MKKGFERVVMNYEGKQKYIYIGILILVSRGTAIIGFPTLFGFYWGVCAMLSLFFDSYISRHKTYRYLLSPERFRVGRIAAIALIPIVVVLIDGIVTTSVPIIGIAVAALLALPMWASYYHLEARQAQRNILFFLSVLGLAVAATFYFGPYIFLLSAIGGFCLYFFLFSFRVFGR